MYIEYVIEYELEIIKIIDEFFIIKLFIHGSESGQDWKANIVSVWDPCGMGAGPTDAKKFLLLQ